MREAGIIDSGLIERIRDRLKEDWRRTGDGDWLRMPKELRPKHESATIMGGIMGSMLQSVIDYQPPEPQELKPIEPLSATAVEKVEKMLGFALPRQLRQLYLEIGDGGFGPFNGIRRLANWAKDYQKLRAEPIGEKRREWPAELLPIVYLNGQRICVDKESGAVLRWTKPPKRCSEAKWAASFAPQAGSVAEWLEAWVDTPTQMQGGPDGGWAPPTEEIERRARVRAEREARAAAAEEKARTFTIAELAPLPAELLERVRARTTDPARRTYMASARATPLEFDDLEEQLERNANVIPGHAFAAIAGMLGGLRRLAPLTGELGLSMVTSPSGGMMMMKSGSGGKLGAPATDAALAHAAETLGFALPKPMQQLYRIADGGFGPGDCGLLSIAKLVTRYRKLTSKPAGPSGEPWPAKLLPIYECDDAIGCLDLESGKITVYDPSRMEDIHGGYFRRSFVTEHRSLAELMQAWLGQRTFAEDQARQEQLLKKQGERIRRQVEAGTYRAFSDPAEQAEAEIRFYGFLTPEQRAEDGLPETGWEDEIRRRNGLI